MEISEKPELTLADLEDLFRQLGEAVARLTPDTVGRQRDVGADLRYTGYLLLLQYEDPAKPGSVFTANPSRWHVADPKLARFQARRDMSLVNGIIGPRDAIATSMLDHFGELRPALGILAALGALPADLAALVTRPSDLPGDLLEQLLRRRR